MTTPKVSRAQGPIDHGVPLVHDRIREAALAVPDAVAIASQDGSTLSYRELEAATNAVAHALRRHGVGSDAAVALCVDRSPEAVVALIGTIKAGGAYVPIDVSTPTRRKDEMIAASGARLVIASSRDAVPSGVEVLRLDDLMTTREAASSEAHYPRPDLAYIIFTSGSTGAPKATMITHRGLSRYLEWADSALPRGGNGSLLHTSLAFDFSVTSLFVPLVRGETVAILPEGARMIDLLASVRSVGELSFLRLTPSHVDGLSVLEGSTGAIRAKAILVGGEQLTGAHVDALRRCAPRARIINHYGPTEAVVGRCTFELPASWDGARVPIGRPLPGTTAVVVDEELNATSPGQPGELCLGGGDLARGYLGHPRLTADRFVPDPFSSEPGGRMYRTGDRATVGVSGAIDFLGRLDDQIKIRGFRVEPGEIEARLRDHPAVAAAVVTSFEDGNGAYLAAYVVPHAGDLVPADVRRHLGNVLPDYMIPTVFVPMVALPLTTNGKIDRGALPPALRGGTTQAFVAPRTEGEAVLVALLEELLGVDGIGIEDNFFELGGDSILAIRFAVRARERGIEIDQESLFEGQTIAGLLSTKLEIASGAAPGSDIPIGPMQRRFLRTIRDVAFSHCQAVAVRLPDEALPVLPQVLDAVADHHESFRTRFALSDRDRAFVDAAASPVLLELEGADLMAVRSSLAAAMNLHDGPLLAAGICGSEDGHVLALAAHHLAVDAISWSILLSDLGTALDQARRGVAIALPRIPTPASVWAGRLEELATQLDVDDREEDWRSALPGEALCRIAPDAVAAPMPIAVVERRVRIEDVLRQTSQQGLLGQRAHQAAVVSSVARACARHAGSESFTVDVEGHGRHASLGVDLSRTVGWLTSLYPVRVRERGAVTTRDVHDHLARLPYGGVDFGILRHVMQRPAVGPQATVRVNYLGRLDDVTDDRTLRRVGAPMYLIRDPGQMPDYALDVAAYDAGQDLVIRFEHLPSVLATEEVRSIIEHVTAMMSAPEGVG